MSEDAGNAPSTPDVFVSVIICTHRRADSLALTLESLAREQYRGNDWEVLVIENDTAASEDVSRVVERYSSVLPTKWYLETVPNLSRARNLGAREARGEYLAYIDDDAEVVNGWLEALISGCREYHPDFCGGPSYPLYRTSKPYWYKDEWATSYQYGSIPARTEQPLGGMNFTVRRELAVSLGGFREYLGMAGDKLAYGEEVDLLIRAREAHPDLVAMYFPDVAVRHEVRPAKMAIRWCIQSTWALARDCLTARVTGKHYHSWPHIAKLTIRSSLRLLCKLPVLLVVAFCDLFRPRRGVWRRYVKECLIPDMSALFSAMHAAAFHLGRQTKSE